MRKILCFVISSLLIICGNASAQFAITTGAQHPYKHLPKDLQTGGQLPSTATGLVVKVSDTNHNIFEFEAEEDTTLTDDATVTIGDGTASDQQLIFNHSSGTGVLKFNASGFDFDDALNATSFSTSGTGQSVFQQGVSINDSMGSTADDDTEIRSDTLTPLYVDASLDKLIGLGTWDLSGATVTLPSGSALTSSSIDTSAELDAIVGDNTGSGMLVFNNSPTMTGITVNTSLTIAEGILSDSSIVTGDIKDGTILEADLSAIDSPGDEECLTSEGTGFEWQSCGSGGLASTDIDTSAELAAIITDETGTGQIVFNNGATMTGLTVTTSLTIAEGILADSTIVSADIKDNTIAAADIAADAVQASELDVSDVSDDIAADIAEGELADSIVVSADVKDNTLTASDMADSLDFGGDTSFEIPNSAAPVVDTMGEIAVDSTDDQFQYMGASKRVLPYTYEKCFSIETLAAGDDNIPIWTPVDAITITSQRCTVTGAGTGSLYIHDAAGNAMEQLDCVSGGKSDDGSLVYPNFTANESMSASTVAVTGTVTWINFCNRYTFDSQ